MLHCSNSFNQVSCLLITETRKFVAASSRIRTKRKILRSVPVSEPKAGLCRLRPCINPQTPSLALPIFAINKMVLGILTAIAACPAIIGTTEAVRQGQRQSAKEKHRGLKTNLSVVCSRATKGGREIDGCEVVLSENKVRVFLPISAPDLSFFRLFRS